jgi:hypothetical protein
MTAKLYKQIEKDFGKVCGLAGQYNRLTGAIRSSSPAGQRIVRELNALSQSVFEALGEADTEIERSVSRGMSNLPKILWLAFLLPYARVSLGLSVTACFGRRGEGAVLGLMLPSGLDSASGMVAIKRGVTLVNVNGVKKDSQYSDKFVNPREFMLEGFSSADFVSHTRESLILLRNSRPF